MVTSKKTEFEIGTKMGSEEVKKYWEKPPIAPLLFAGALMYFHDNFNIYLPHQIKDVLLRAPHEVVTDVYCHTSKICRVHTLTVVCGFFLPHQNVISCWELFVSVASPSTY
jgi:hypothetical protein